MVIFGKVTDHLHEPINPSDTLDEGHFYWTRSQFSLDISDVFADFAPLETAEVHTRAPRVNNWTFEYGEIAGLFSILVDEYPFYRNHVLETHETEILMLDGKKSSH
jgi:hypothetical protein